MTARHQAGHAHRLPIPSTLVRLSGESTPTRLLVRRPFRMVSSVLVVTHSKSHASSGAVVTKKIISESEARELFRLCVHLLQQGVRRANRAVVSITDARLSSPSSIRSTTHMTPYTSGRLLL